MKFILGIKPTIITGLGTTFHALEKIRQSTHGYFCYSSSFGNAYIDALVNPKYVYGYNIEVFKRGKYRKDKHYVIYMYSFPIKMFKLLNVHINQGTRTFTIIPNKR